PRPDRRRGLRDRPRPGRRRRGRPRGGVGHARRRRALESVAHGSVPEGKTKNEQQRTTDFEPKKNERNRARTPWTEHSGGLSTPRAPRWQEKPALPTPVPR